MDLDTPPLMRKLLIGHLFNDPENFPIYDENQQIWHQRCTIPGKSSLAWSLIWLQGVVIEANESRNAFTLDDATGRIAIYYDQAAQMDRPPTVGWHVAVIGQLVSPATSRATPAEAKWRVDAKSVTRLIDVFPQKAEQRIDGKWHLNPVAASELSWPLEVQDMTRLF